jgi:hypothetical protein
MTVSAHYHTWRYRRRWIAAGVIAACVGAVVAYTELSGGSRALGEVAAEPAPATLRPIGDTGLNRVVLSAHAAARLGIRTTPVRGSAVPYSALIYAPNGEVWTYSQVGPLTFVRHRVAVEQIAGNRAFVRNGPRAGSRVVTTGAAELFGAEFEFAED